VEKLMPALLILGIALVVFMAKSNASFQYSKVLRIERANGVDGRLMGALEAWEQHGPFVIMVGKDGGVRDDEDLQAELYSQGLTKASTLERTPHGRGGALDLWPVVDGVPVFANHSNETAEGRNQNAKELALYQEMGTWFKRMGFVWGGDWKGLRDYPHVEIANWTSLPYPPLKDGVA
jgi:hypothetical protein